MFSLEFFVIRTYSCGCFFFGISLMLIEVHLYIIFLKFNSIFFFSPFLGISEQWPTGNSPGLYVATWARKEFLFLLVHTLPLGRHLNLMRMRSQLASN